MPKQETIDSQPSQTLAKGLMILSVFSLEHPSWGVRELARTLNMHPATVSRLVTTLQGTGYLEQDPATSRYALGPAVMKLANLYLHQNPLPRFSQKVFASYADRFDHNFYLGTLSGYEVVYLAALDGRGRIKVVVEPGGSTGLHTTALGKVLLAYQDDGFIERFIETQGLQVYTANSITTSGELWRQIHEIRLAGIAINDGEHFEDIGAVAAPVFNSQGQITAGVSLAYPRNFAAAQTIDPYRLVPLLKEITQKISIYVSAQRAPSG